MATALLTIKADGQEARKTIEDLQKLLDKMQKTAGDIKIGGTDAKSGGTDAKTETKKLTEEVSKLQSAAEKAGSAIKNDLVSAFNTIKTETTVLAIQAVTDAIHNALKEIRDIDDELVAIRRVTGKSGTELDELVARSAAVAKAYGVSVSEYLSSVTAFSKAGYGDAAEGLAELSVKAQRVGDMTAETADAFLLAANAAYGYGGNLTELGKALDGANEIGNNFATDIDKIAVGFGKVSTIAAQSHVSIYELEAALGTITAVTQRSGSEAATALRALFLNIIGDTKTEIEDGATWTAGEIDGLRDVLKLYAADVVNAAEATGQVINPMEAIGALAKSYKDGILTEAALMEMVSDIGGKLRTSQLLALIQNWDMYNEMLSTAESATGSADREIENSLDSITVKMEQLKATWVALWTDADTSAFIKNALDSMTSLVSQAGDLQTALAGIASILLILRGGPVGIGVGAVLGIGTAATMAYNKREKENKGLADISKDAADAAESLALLYSKYASANTGTSEYTTALNELADKLGLVGKNAADAAKEIETLTLSQMRQAMSTSKNAYEQLSKNYSGTYADFSGRQRATRAPDERELAGISQELADQYVEVFSAAFYNSLSNADSSRAFIELYDVTRDWQAYAEAYGLTYGVDVTGTNTYQKNQEWLNMYAAAYENLTAAAESYAEILAEIALVETQMGKNGEISAESLNRTAIALDDGTLVGKKAKDKLYGLYAAVFSDLGVDWNNYRYGTSSVKSFGGETPESQTVTITADVETDGDAKEVAQIVEEDGKTVNIGVKATQKGSDTDEIVQAFTGEGDQKNTITRELDFEIPEKSRALLDGIYRIMDENGEVTLMVDTKTDENGDASTLIGLIEEIDGKTITTFYTITGNGLAQIKEIQKIGDQITETKEMKVTADTAAANSRITGLLNKLNQLKSKTFTVNAMVKSAASTGAGAGTQTLRSSGESLLGSILKTFGIGGNAKGTKYFGGGLSMINEEGPELVTADGWARILANGEPTIANIPKGATIYTAKETAQILGGAKQTAFPAFAAGTGNFLGNLWNTAKKVMPALQTAEDTFNQLKNIFNVDSVVSAAEAKKTEEKKTDGTKSGSGSGGGSAKKDEAEFWDTIQEYIQYGLKKIQYQIDERQDAITALEKERDRLMKPLDDEMKELDWEISEAEYRVKLIERSRDDATRALKEQIDALRKAREIEEDEEQLEEKRLAVIEAENALKDAQYDRTVRYYNEATGQWEWMADQSAVKNAEDALKDAQEAYEDALAEYQIKQLERQVEAIEEMYDNQAKPYQDTLEEYNRRMEDLQYQRDRIEQEYARSIDPLSDAMDEIQQTYDELSKYNEKVQDAVSVPTGDLEAALTAMQSADENYSGQFDNVQSLLDALYAVAPTWSAINPGTLGMTAASGAISSTNFADVLNNTGTTIVINGLTVEGDGTMSLNELIAKAGIYRNYNE